jgi:hypothetical protein
MAEKKTQIESITILRGTVFAGELVEPGAVCPVDDGNRAAAKYLIRNGKAIEGAVKPAATARADKRISEKDLETK